MLKFVWFWWRGDINIPLKRPQTQSASGGEELKYDDDDDDDDDDFNDDDNVFSSSKRSSNTIGTRGGPINYDVDDDDEDDDDNNDDDEVFSKTTFVTWQQSERRKMSVLRFS